MSATTTSMDLTRLELEAKATARKQVANLLQRPDQLEKVDQIRRRVSRKKVRGNFSHCFAPLNSLCFHSFGQYAVWLKNKKAFQYDANCTNFSHQMSVPVVGERSSNEHVSIGLQ